MGMMANPAVAAAAAAAAMTSFMGGRGVPVGFNPLLAMASMMQLQQQMSAHGAPVFGEAAAGGGHAAPVAQEPVSKLKEKAELRNGTCLLCSRVHSCVPHCCVWPVFLIARLTLLAYLCVCSLLVACVSYCKIYLGGITCAFVRCYEVSFAAPYCDQEAQVWRR